MGIRHDQTSAYIQERRKWEIRPTVVDAQWISSQIIDGVKRAGFMDGTYIEPIPIEQGGHANWPYQEYPRWVFKAKRADGGPVVDVLNGGGMIVHTEQEHHREKNRGWCDTQEEAIAAIRQEDREWAKLAAERNHEVRRMSPKAQAEVAAVDEANSNHVPVIPETPIKKRGRPAKIKE